ncbi:MAG: M23 family metallopeptidase [Nitrospirae bacterium]|nr:M23 family metallopeptidase [Nitrospirota bacterium]
MLILISLLYSTPVFAEPSLNVSVKPDKIKQGDIILITVKAEPGKDNISGSLFNKPIRFYTEAGTDYYSALAGVDMETEEGQYPLSLSLKDDKGAEIKKDYGIEVISAGFGKQELTVPKEKAEPDEETLKRIKLEEEEIAKIWGIITEGHLWQGNFILPVEGELSEDFGLRRIINGEPRKPHSGVDISASGGAPISAANHGRVIFTGEHFFSGKSIVIDHGLGLFSMYFHLSDILVKEGQPIKKGEVIGKVGSTGRATGPHLHWGMRLNGARVNPASLLDKREK